MTAHGFADAVLTLALRFRFSVQSWGRSRRHNADEKGLVDSFHLTWTGADGVLDPGEDLIAFTLRANQLGVQVVDEGDHLHLEPR